MMRRSTITPPERGRASTRRSSTVKTNSSIAERTGSLNRSSRSQVKDSPEQRRSAVMKSPHNTTNQKKRTAGSPASVDSGSIVTRKRRRTSTDTVSSLDERRSSSSRRSSREKIEIPSGIKTKQESSKLSQDQKTPTSVNVRSSARIKTKEADKPEEDKKSSSSERKKARDSDGVIHKLKFPKGHAKDLKDSLANEMKRLSTTEGFWTSRGSRSGSPLSVLEGNERGMDKQTSSQRSSRTSTPDVSPSSIRRKSFINTLRKQTDKSDGVKGEGSFEKQKGLEVGSSRKQSDKTESGSKKFREKEDTSSKPSVGELRRLKTTDGFWSPSFAALGPRNSSRDASPSSTSSLDRGVRQSARSISRGSDSRTDDTAIEEDDQQRQRSTSRSVTRRSNVDDTGAESDSSGKVIQRRNVIGKAIGRGGHKTHIMSRRIFKPRRFKDSTEENVINSQSSTAQGTGSVDHRSSKVATRGRPAVRRLHRHSFGSNFGRTSPTKMRGAAFRGLKRKCSDRTPRKSVRRSNSSDTQQQSAMEEEDVSEPTNGPTSVMPGNASPKPMSSSPEFAISDLLGSAELKRLNTTAGFWAPTPDIGIVLGVLPRRLRDGDLGAPKDLTDQEEGETNIKNTVVTGKHKLSPLKPQSSLLQHRKKKLHSLKQTFKRSRIFSRSKASGASTFHDNGQSAKRSDTDSDLKPKRKRFVFGARKRKGKKRRKQRTHFEALNGEDIEDQNEIASSEPESSPYAPTSTLYNRGQRKMQNVTEEKSEAGSFVKLTDSAAGGRGRTTWRRGRRKVISPARTNSSVSLTSERSAEMLTSSQRNQSLVSEPRSGLPRGRPKKIWRRGRRKLIPSASSNHVAPENAETSPPVKTWKRGRKKLIPGAVRHVIRPVSNIRTRGKDNDSLNKSLEVLQSLEPAKTQQHESPTVGTSQYISLIVETAARGPVVQIQDIKTIEFKTVDRLVGGKEIPNKEIQTGRGCKIFDDSLSHYPDLGHIHEKSDRKEPKHIGKKDNLFESLGFDFNGQPDDIAVATTPFKEETADKTVTTKDKRDAVATENKEKEEVTKGKHPQNDNSKDGRSDNSEEVSLTCDIEMETSDESVVPKAAQQSEVTETSATTNENNVISSGEKDVFTHSFHSSTDSVSTKSQDECEVVDQNCKDMEKTEHDDIVDLKNETDTLSGGIATTHHAPCTIVEDVQVSEDTGHSSGVQPEEPGDKLMISQKTDVEIVEQTGNVENIDKLEEKTMEVENTVSEMTEEGFAGGYEASSVEKCESATDIKSSANEANTYCTEDILTSSVTNIQEIGKEDDVTKGSSETECVEEEKESWLCGKVSEGSGETSSEPHEVSPEKLEVSNSEVQGETGPSSNVDDVTSTVQGENQEAGNINSYKTSEAEADHSGAQAEECAITSHTDIPVVSQATGITQQYGTDVQTVPVLDTQVVKLPRGRPKKKRKKIKTRFFIRKKHTFPPAADESYSKNTEVSGVQNQGFASSNKDSVNMAFGQVGQKKNGDTSQPQGPLRRVRRRRRNAWQRGVVRKAVNMSRKVEIKAPASFHQIPADGSIAVSVPETVQKPSSDSTNVNQFSVPTSSNPSESSFGEHMSAEKAARAKKFAMLKRLQTNANLASADVDVKSLKGRFLRTLPVKEKKKNMQRKRAAEDPNVQYVRSEWTKARSSMGIAALHIDIPGENIPHGPTGRKRGRPRKNRDESLPKLTPTNLQPLRRANVSWNKAPPRLSPQIFTSSSSTTQAIPDVFFPLDDSKNARDIDFVSESVDETDFHLYLSGVSDEDTSPLKDSTPVSGATQNVQIPLDLDGTDVNSNVQASAKERSSLSERVKVVSTLSMPILTAAGGKEPKKLGRKKMKGRRGRPPGIPMTDEERRKKAEKKESPPSDYEGSGVFKRPRTARKSMMYSASSPSSYAGTPMSKFSLRKKSTRSPLEMLEMKRKQEEAMYDMEQEKRQARLIHLREKRSARESGDDRSDDGDGGAGEENLKLCSVVLSDFVKKLQLDNLDSPSGDAAAAPDSKGGTADSPDYDPFDDQDQEDEDWCADLEDFDDDDDEWDVRKQPGNRPHIPRLKLKRVMKKGKSSQITRSKPVPILPKPAQHEPIKLLIKTEPVGDPEDWVSKSATAVDISKMERSGFEGSFLDFLKGKRSEVFMHSKLLTPQKKTYISKPVHSQPANLQKNTTVLSKGTEILSLPTTGLKTTSPESVKSAAVSETPSISGTSEVTKPAAEPTQKAALVPAHIDERLESSEQSKNSLSVEDEEDDILILDLDEGAHDQISSDSQKDSAATPVQVTGPESSQEASDRIRERLQNPVQRTNSNDEMGLMLASYDGPGHQIQTDNTDDKNKTEESLNSTENVEISDTSPSSRPIPAAASLEKDGKVEDSLLISTGAEKTANGAISEPTTMTAIDSSEVAQDSVKSATSVTEELVQAGEERISGAQEKAGSDAAPLTKDTIDSTDMPGQELSADSSAIAKDGADKTHRESGSDKEVVETDNEDLSNFNQAKSEASLTSSEPPKKETSETTTQEGIVAPVNETESPVCTSPEHANMASKSSPKSTTIIKKSSASSENSKSPKHNSYISSRPEDWKVKVITQSDKLPSGKYTCKRCNFATSTKLTIESHLYSHIPGVQFLCAYCESEFSSMAATSTHLKNTHALSEAKLRISRHIDEKNFYDKEDTVYPEENVQSSSTSSQPVSSAATGGQSPPLIISVVVSGAMGANRGGRSSAPPRRFVCTHCGFSTNVRGDAEHHVSDLHPSQSLFACTLCNENIAYSEDKIKDHSATVHPSRSRPYRKLPDFYDAEQLNQKGKVADADDRENIFERMSSIFQDDNQGNTSNIDHKQKAKDYLYLQEGWREKTSAEADSTTAVDYTDDHDNAEDRSAPESPSAEDNHDEIEDLNNDAENEASEPSKSLSPRPAVLDLSSAKSATVVPDEGAITSSAGNTTTTNNSGLDETTGPPIDFASLAPAEETVGDEEPHKTDSKRVPDATKSPQPGSLAKDSTETPTQPSMGSQEGEEENSGEGIGLKIVQVVSLSGQVEGEEAIPMTSSREQVVGEEKDRIGEKAPQTDPLVSKEPAVSATTQLSGESTHSETTSSIPTTTASGQSTIQNQISDQDPRSSGPQQTQPTSATSSSGAESTNTTSSSSSSTTNASLAGGLPLSYKCNACKVHTPYLLMMVKHLKAKHPNMRCFACPYCKTTHSFVSQKQLRHHVKQSHPDKVGRNEIALSEEAKKFVEAMVLPNSPECTRIGNRVVLEEDIHTCTYCQLKMTSLANVYEHLNDRHSDLFEFVCPVCQSFKSKVLDEISDHCTRIHKSTLDTDKVHVSVPKNLFIALTCISKNGKYIEKTLDANAEGSGTTSSSSKTSSAPSTTSSQQQPTKSSAVTSSQTTTATPPTPTPAPETSGKVPASVDTVGGARAPVLIPLSSQALPQMSPLIAIPLVTGGIGNIPTIATSRPVIISSALFDTSSLATPPELATTQASQAVPVIQGAAAASFLAPRPHQNQGFQSQPSPQSLQKQAGVVKNLPVLNVPTVKPRVTSAVSRSAETVRKPEHPVSPIGPPLRAHSSSSISPLSTSVARHTASAGPPNASPTIDNLPEDEPNPDAFKIFNLRPTRPLVPPTVSAPPTASPEVPTVFPPVSTPISSGYIQGPIAGFPAGMVISPNLLPHSFPFPQQQQLVSAMLSSSASPGLDSTMPRFAHLSQPPASAISTAFRHQAMERASAGVSGLQSGFRHPQMSHIAPATATRFLKKQQQRELSYLKQQRQIQRFEAIRQQQLQSEKKHRSQGQPHPQLLPKAVPAHQQPPSLSGQVYQPHSASPHPTDQNPAHSDHHLQHHHHNPSSLSTSASSASCMSSASSSSSLTASVTAANTARLPKGQHKRSSSLYQCPYCPTVVTLKALEVASHIQQLHPGSAVVFRKIVS